eukprot:m.79159 g.79159  ORF g.79159 m.79159 type:complete len:54 (-) comp17406_c1_seq1:56-217(-)
MADDKSSPSYNSAFGTQKKYKWKVGAGGSYAAGVPPTATQAPPPRRQSGGSEE